jgi:hypothetical protein
MAGLWRQEETKDGTYSYIDLLDILEMINVQNENRLRDEEFRWKEAHPNG